MPRPTNTTRRRAEIVDGLITVMAERGYEGASVAAIARAAGLAPGLVHYHFATKQAILTAAIAHLVAGLDQRFHARLAGAGADPALRLAAFVDAHLALGEGADPRAVRAWVIIGAEAVKRAEVRPLYAAAIADRLAVLTTLLRARLRAECRSLRGTRRLAAALMSAIEGAYQLAAAAPGVLPSGFAAPALHRVIDGLVASQPPL